MIALCREAREALIDEINSHQELRKDRWRVDRSPCLYALDAQGERLNDGDWCAWTRRKSDVEELLRRHPDAHQIIVDGGLRWTTPRSTAIAPAPTWRCRSCPARRCGGCCFPKPKRW